MRIRINILIVLLLAAGTGCIHLEQRITVHGDGSGLISLHYSVPIDKIDSMASCQAAIDRRQRSAGAPGTTGPNWFLNNRLAHDCFQGKAITLEENRSYDEDGRRHVVLQCRATDMRKALATGQFGDFSIEPGREGNYVFRAQLPEAPLRGAPSPERIREFQALFEGMVLRLVVKVPSQILDSTAKDLSGTTATWELKPGENAELLKRNPTVSLTFSGTDLAWDTSPPSPAPARD